MARVLGLALCCLTACSVAVSAWNTGVQSQVETGQQERDLYWSVVDIQGFFTTTHIAIVAGGGGGGLLLLIVLITGVCCCCCYRRKKCCFKPPHHGRLERRPLLNGSYQSPDALYTNRGQVEVKGGRRYEKTVGEEFRRQRDEQEQSDRALAKKIILFHLRNEKRLELTRDLPDMGSRMLKFWFMIHDQASNREQLLTIAPVSQKCPLNLDNKTTKTINSLLIQLSHPNLHPVLDVSYVSKDHMVLIRQPYIPGGSLKDVIYRSKPICEWTMKYSRRCKGLSGAKVALYGRQILDGLVYLYDHNFPPLGHIQTGNVFMEGDTCRLGGYENALLGYKTRAYKLCKEHLEDIDLILFGHVIFEMSCGYEMTELAPGEGQYVDVKDRHVLQILQFIFQTEEGNFAHSIWEVLAQQFFQDARPPIQRGGRADHTELSGDIKALLAKVKKNKPRVQKYTSKRRRRSAPPKPPAIRGVASPSSLSDAESAGPQSKLS